MKTNLPRYCFIAFLLSSKTFAYCFTNFGINLPFGKLPSISICTSTWPEHPLPAPIPMVGIFNFSVINSDTGAGTASKTKLKQPASWSARASVRSFEALAAVLPCTRKPPRECERCGVRPMWPRTGMPIEVILDIVGANSMPPSSLTAYEMSDQRAGMRVNRVRKGRQQAVDQG